MNSSQTRNGDGLRDFDTEKLYTLQEMIAAFDVAEIGRRSFMVREKKKVEKLLRFSETSNSAGRGGARALWSCGVSCGEQRADARRHGLTSVV